MNHENEILSTLSNKEKELITYKNYKKGETIQNEEDTCSFLYIVIKGEVKICTYLENGNEVLFNTVKENQMFGMNLLFSSKPYFKGDVICTLDTKIALISQNSLINLMQSNKDFLLKYLNYLANFGISLNNSIKLLALPTIEERFDFLLEENKGTIKYSTITNLANEINVKRESLSRYIHKIEKEGLITNKNKVIKKLNNVI